MDIGPNLRHETKLDKYCNVTLDVRYLGGEAEGEGLAGGLVVSVQVTEGGGKLVMVGHTRRHGVRPGPGGSEEEKSG